MTRLLLLVCGLYCCDTMKRLVELVRVPSSPHEQVPSDYQTHQAWQTLGARWALEENKTLLSDRGLGIFMLAEII